MKRNYFEPEMEILTFSMENVVTASAAAVTGASINNSVINNSATGEQYANTSAQTVLEFSDFGS